MRQEVASAGAPGIDAIGHEGAMQNGATDEDGPVIADAAYPIAPRPMETMKAVGPIGATETVGETMAEPAVTVEAGVGMETAVPVEATKMMETTEAVKTTEVVEPAMVIDGGFGGRRRRYGGARERERNRTGRDGRLESGSGRGDERRHE